MMGTLTSRSTCLRAMLRVKRQGTRMVLLMRGLLVGRRRRSLVGRGTGQRVSRRLLMWRPLRGWTQPSLMAGLVVTAGV
jgi:hypothetical protein